ncbi:MAG TPA: MinD/ParA family protein [Bacteroidota bacterium]|nr:MinD/ParA family protein [Bacteroidota bacterium]
MRDQANRLREMAAQLMGRSASISAQQPTQGRPRTIVVTSGKGGVGKTNIASNLGIILSGMRKRVVLVDADANLGNTEMVLGLSPRYRLSHVVRNEADIDDALITSYNGLKVLAGDSGKYDFPTLTTATQKQLLSTIYEADTPKDIVLIDTSAGLSDEILFFAVQSDDVIIITTPEPTAVMDAYAMVKLIQHTAQGRMPALRLIVNMAKTPREAEATYRNLESVIQHFLHEKIEFLGFLLHDPSVGKSVCAQTPVVVHAPHSSVALSLRAIAHKLIVNGR